MRPKKKNNTLHYEKIKCINEKIYYGGNSS